MNAAVPATTQSSAAMVSRSRMEQVAIVLLGLGEERASRILNKMSVKEVNQILQVIPRISDVVESELEAIMKSIVMELDDAPLFSDKSRIETVLRQSLGRKRAMELLHSAKGEEYGEVLEKLLLLDPKLITRLIIHEHPQLQAVVLACLDSSKSAQILQNFEEENQIELIDRIASLNAVPTSSLEAIAALLDTLSEEEVGSYSINGVGQLAEVLNHMDVETGDQLLGHLRERNDDLAEQVSSLRFTFDHVLELTSEALRILIEAADSEVLSKALRGLPAERLERIYSSMGKRAAGILRDDLESGAGVRASRVNEARVQLTALARKMGREGKIDLISASEEMVN